MRLRTVRRACESHQRYTDTAQGQRAAAAPGAPPQGLADAQGKVLPGPHSRLSPRDQAISPYRLHIKTCLLLHLLLQEPGRQPGAKPAALEGPGAKG